MNLFKQTDTSKIDKNLFKKLDENSKNLRDSAKSLADFLMPIKNPPKEVSAITAKFNALATCKIEDMDKAMDDLKNSFLMFELAMKKYSTLYKLIGEDQIKKCMEKYERFAQETNTLVEKAFELNKNH